MTLHRVSWFGQHVEILGDVIIYPVLFVARTGEKERARRKKRGEEKKA